MRALLLLMVLCACAARPPAVDLLALPFAERPRWAPDRSALALLSDREGAPRVFVQAPDGKLTPVTPPDQNVKSFSWSRSANSLLYEYDRGGDGRTQLGLVDLRDMSLRCLTGDRPDAVHELGAFGAGDQVFISSNRRDPAHFDLYRLGRGLELLYRGQGRIVPVRVSPDQNRLLFRSEPGPPDHRLFLLDLAEGEARALTRDARPTVYESPRFENRGRSLTCVTNRGREFRALMRLDLKSGQWKVLVEGSGDLELWDRSSEGRLCYTLNDRGYSRLYFDHREITGFPPGVIRSLTALDDGTLCFALSGPTQPDSVWTRSPDGALKKVYEVGPALPDLLSPQAISYPGADGLEIPAFLYRPEKPTRRAVVLLHGGPADQSRPEFAPLAQVLCRQGIAVLYPNVRGSTGYGAKFEAADDLEKRPQAVQDVALAARYLRSQGYTRLGLGGWSYGGWLALIVAERYPDDWLAVAEIDGIADPVSYFRQTSPWRWENRSREYGAEMASPLQNAAKLRAPLLIIHGARDPKVPVEQARSLARAVPSSTLLVLEDAGHGPVTRQQRSKVGQALVDFFGAHL